MSATVRTRFAPSPSGALHIGGARTALFAWLYARRHGGRFVLRIEDTDRARSDAASVEAILAGLAWLGLDIDEGPFLQSERLDRHREAARRMLAAGTAYHCYCTPEELQAMRDAQLAAGEKPRYDGRCRDRREPRAGVQPVVRLKTPRDGETAFDDRVHGRVRVANAELDDLVLLRSDGTPTYNLSVVVDDLDMGVTQVLRGDDHLNNTPRQINILRALGETPPEYAHLPMILSEKGERLSKRSAADNILSYRDAGYLPAAVLNYLGRLGGSWGDDEILSLEEMAARFDFGHVNKAPARLNPEKLDWLNRHYLAQAPLETLAPLFAAQLAAADFDARPPPAPEEVLRALLPRYSTLADMAAGAAYFYRDPELDAARARALPAQLLRAARDALAAVGAWDEAAIKAALQDCAARAEVKFGALGKPLREALTAGAPAPGLAETLALIGRDRCLARLDRALREAAGGG